MKIKRNFLMIINFIEMIYFSLITGIIFICYGCDGFGIINRYGRGKALGYPCNNCNGVGLIFDIYKLIIIIIIGLIIYFGFLFFEKIINNKEKIISKYSKIKFILLHKVIVIIVIIIGIICGMISIIHGFVLNPSIAGGILMFGGFISMVSGCILFFSLNK